MRSPRTRDTFDPSNSAVTPIGSPLPSCNGLTCVAVTRSGRCATASLLLSSRAQDGGTMQRLVLLIAIAIAMPQRAEAAGECAALPNVVYVQAGDTQTNLLKRLSRALRDNK